MQASGMHNDIDNPPNVPAITGRPVTKRKEKDKDNSFADALTGGQLLPLQNSLLVINQLHLTSLRQVNLPGYHLQVRLT